MMCIWSTIFIVCDYFLCGTFYAGLIAVERVLLASQKPLLLLWYNYCFTNAVRNGVGRAIIGYSVHSRAVV